PRLQRYRGEFSEDFSAEEVEFLEGLKTSGDRWRSEFVHRYAPFKKPARWTDKVGNWVRGGLVLPARRWTAAASAVGISVIVVTTLAVIEGPIIIDKFELNKAKNLTIQASSDQPIEMRIPYARYAPYEKEMGPSSGSKSPALLEAQAIVGRKKRAGHL